MKRKVLITVAVVFMCLLFALPITTQAQAPAPLNTVSLDVTINSAGEVSVGGYNLRSLGLGVLSDQVKVVTKDLDSAHFVLQGELVTLDVKGTPVLKIQWNAASRQMLTTLALRYGVQINQDQLARIEEWVASSSIDVTAKYSQDASKPVAIKLSKPLLVDLGPDGQVAIEKMPLAYGIEKTTAQMIRLGGISNSVLCWNKGTLTTKVDGKDLPAITLYPKGIQTVMQALGLQFLVSVDPLFTSQFGVDVGMPGGSHQAGTICRYE